MGETINFLSLSHFYTDKRLFCCITCNWVEGDNGQLYIRYGLRFKKAAQTVRDFPDLTSDEKRIRKFALRLNRGRISELHIDDIVYDFILEDSFLAG